MLTGMRARCSIATTATAISAATSAQSAVSVPRLGEWGILWRLAVLLQLAVTTMAFAAVIIMSVYNHDDILGILILLALVVVLEATILYVTHRINKRTYRNNKDILSNL